MLVMALKVRFFLLEVNFKLRKLINYFVNIPIIKFLGGRRNLIFIYYVRKFLTLLSEEDFFFLTLLLSLFCGYLSFPL